jgi:excisionase family DNA binding protein
MTRSPYDELSAALASVVRQAVADALAAVPPSTGSVDTAAMVSVPEAANRLGLGVTKTKKLIASGDIPSVMLEGRRLVPVAGIESYVDQLIGPSAS